MNIIQTHLKEIYFFFNLVYSTDSAVIVFDCFWHLTFDKKQKLFMKHIHEVIDDGFMTK